MAIRLRRGRWDAHAFRYGGAGETLTRRNIETLTLSATEEFVAEAP